VSLGRPWLMALWHVKTTDDSSCNTTMSLWHILMFHRWTWVLTHTVLSPGHCKKVCGVWKGVLLWRCVGCDWVCCCERVCAVWDSVWGVTGCAIVRGCVGFERVCGVWRGVLLWEGLWGVRGCAVVRVCGVWLGVPLWDSVWGGDWVCCCERVCAVV